MDARNLPEIPPGPADVVFPRRALSRLALSSAAAETAETAAGHVPTDADGDAYQVVEYAARLASSAEYVLTRAVVHARELGGSWADIAEALGVPEDAAHWRYDVEVERWEDALDRPWEHSGHFLASRLPDGLSDPQWTAEYLDRWCARHIPETSAARSLAKTAGTEDRMVSANLPRHTTLTEVTSVARYARYLTEHDCSDAELRAHQARKADVFARADAELHGHTPGSSAPDSGVEGGGPR